MKGKGCERDYKQRGRAKEKMRPGGARRKLEGKRKREEKRIREREKAKWKEKGGGEGRGKTYRCLSQNHEVARLYLSCK